MRTLKQETSIFNVVWQNHRNSLNSVSESLPVTKGKEVSIDLLLEENGKGPENIHDHS